MFAPNFSSRVKHYNSTDLTRSVEPFFPFPTPSRITRVAMQSGRPIKITHISILSWVILVTCTFVCGLNFNPYKHTFYRRTILESSVLRLHSDAVVVDTHFDTLKCLIPMFTLPRNSQWDDRSKIGMGVRSDLGHVDIPRLKEGG